MNNYITMRLSIVILIFGSCSKNDKPFEQSRFENTEILDPVKVELHGKELLNPWAISIVDSTLMIIENGVSSEIISLVSLKDLKLLHSFGKRGRGPNEFSDIIQHPVSLAGNEISSIQVFDWVNKRLKQYNTENVLKGLVNDSLRQYVLPPDLLLTQRAAFLNDTTVIAMGGIYNGLLAFINTNTDEVIYADPYNLNGSEYSTRDISELYRGEFAINFKNKLIALASKYIPEILITDFKGDIVKKISIAEFNLDKIANTPVEERTLYFYDIKATEDYIYTVYIGKSYSQLEKLLEGPDSVGTVSTSEVYIYSWNGDPIKKFVLKGGYFPFIEIDTQYDRIFSMDLFSSNIDIVYFKPRNDL